MFIIGAVDPVSVPVVGVGVLLQAGKAPATAVRPSSRRKERRERKGCTGIEHLAVFVVGGHRYPPTGSLIGIG
jgi:hypothetical protein